MRRLVFCPALVFLVILRGSVAYAADAGDATLTVSGIEGVEAISSVLSGDALVNQTLVGNRFEERGVVSTSIMQDTFRDGRGIISVNQASGNLNNQANVRVLAFADGESLLYDLSLATSARSIKNIVVVHGGEREDRISNSFGGAIGLVGVNQSAGNLNQQANVVVLGIGVAVGPEAITLEDATLGDISADNSLKSDGGGGSRVDIITDALAGFRGIAQMSQSSGDLNAMGNRIGLSFTVVNGP